MANRPGNPLWVKGKSANPKGKPKGSKDRKWASLDYWFGLVQTEWEHLEPKDRAHIAIDAWKALLSRKLVPLTPEESVQNAATAMNLLKVLENAARNAPIRQTGAGSHTNGMENGAVVVQIEGPSTSSL